jgi:hypothetical protein
LFIILFPLFSHAQKKTAQDTVVQLYGVVMSADSLMGLQGVTVMVKGQNRGTVTNNSGVFSIVVLKGDRVEFSYIGFKSKIVDIPKSLDGNQYSIVQLMVNDTQYLPATIIKRRISREQFERDFVNADVPDDYIAIARKNNDAMTRRFLMSSLPADGREATRMYMDQRARKLYYSGQIAPMNVLNPKAWSEFIKAWKRGDYRKKKA